jgi:hypothetical protein
VHDELRGLRGEPKHHVDHALGAFVNGFDDPRDYYEWFMAYITGQTIRVNGGMSMGG